MMETEPGISVNNNTSGIAAATSTGNIIIAPA
jgi:hypothetical protein